MNYLNSQGYVMGQGRKQAMVRQGGYYVDLLKTSPRKGGGDEQE